MLFAESIGYINAQLAIPQSPPAMTTENGLAGEWSPRYVVKSCLVLSYVIKYMAVPKVSLTIVRQYMMSLNGTLFFLLKWRLNPEYNPIIPWCFTMFFAVLNVPLFWYEAPMALPVVGSETLETFRSAIRTETWALSFVNSNGPGQELAIAMTEPWFTNMQQPLWMIQR